MVLGWFQKPWRFQNLHHQFGFSRQRRNGSLSHLLLPVGFSRRTRRLRRTHQACSAGSSFCRGCSAGDYRYWTEAGQGWWDQTLIKKKRPSSCATRRAGWHFAAPLRHEYVCMRSDYLFAYSHQMQVSGIWPVDLAEGSSQEIINIHHFHFFSIHRLSENPSTTGITPVCILFCRPYGWFEASRHSRKRLKFPFSLFLFVELESSKSRF